MFLLTSSTHIFKVSTPIKLSYRLHPPYFKGIYTKGSYSNTLHLPSFIRLSATFGREINFLTKLLLLNQGRPQHHGSCIYHIFKGTHSSWQEPGCIHPNF